MENPRTNMSRHRLFTSFADFRAPFDCWQSDFSRKKPSCGHGYVFVDTSVLLRSYYAFVSQSLSIVLRCAGCAAECHLQVLERQVYSVARLCPDQTFLLYHRRHVAALCMLCKVNSNSNHYLFSKLPSTSVRVRHPELLLQLIH